MIEKRTKRQLITFAERNMLTLCVALYAYHKAQEHGFLDSTIHLTF